MEHNDEDVLVSVSRLGLAVTYAEMLRNSTSWGDKFTLQQLLEIIDAYAQRASGQCIIPGAWQLAMTVEVYDDLYALIAELAVDPIDTTDIDTDHLISVVAKLIDEYHLGDLHVGEHGAYIFT